MTKRYVEVKSLPETVRKALRSLEYGSADILVRAEEKTRLGSFGGKGRQNYTAAVELVTGQVESIFGSWGGSNAFTTNAVDEGREIDVPPGFVIISGFRGYKPYASLTVHPATLAPLLPEAKEAEALTEDQQLALNILKGIKSGYRAQYFADNVLGEYSAENPHVAVLISKGLAKANKRGALQITTKGRNLADGGGTYRRRK